MTILESVTSSNSVVLVNLLGTGERCGAHRASGFDNQPTWDNNKGGSFDNRPSWDNWSKK
ncbi:MAG: multiple cyclophane-containing RiPP AmcA [Sciscionella sp.]